MEYSNFSGKKLCLKICIKYFLNSLEHIKPDYQTHVDESTFVTESISIDIVKMSQMSSFI